METPYTKPLVEINSIIARGRSIADAITGADRLTGQADILAELAKAIKVAKPRTVDNVHKGVKMVARASKGLGGFGVSFWYRELYQAIAGLHTGKRKCELSNRARKEYLGSLLKAGQSKSPAAVLQRSLSVANNVAARLVLLDSYREPKGKLIQAGRLIQGVEEIEGLLSAVANQFVIVCDAYCSRRTLRVLERVGRGIPVTLLTMKITDGELPFSDALARVRQAGKVVKVAIFDGKPGFHDRFVLTAGRGWTIGTSLKDIGNRDTLIHEIDNHQEVSKMVDDYLSGSRGTIRWL